MRDLKISFSPILVFIIYIQSVGSVCNLKITLKKTNKANQRLACVKSIHTFGCYLAVTIWKESVASLLIMCYLGVFIFGGQVEMFAVVLPLRPSLLIINF